MGWPASASHPHVAPHPIPGPCPQHHPEAPLKEDGVGVAVLSVGRETQAYGKPHRAGVAGAPGQNCGTGEGLEQTRTLWTEAMALPRLQPTWTSGLGAGTSQPWSRDPAWRPAQSACSTKMPAFTLLLKWSRGREADRETHAYLLRVTCRA